MKNNIIRSYEKGHNGFIIETGDEHKEHMLSPYVPYSKKKQLKNRSNYNIGEELNESNISKYNIRKYDGKTKQKRKYTLKYVYNEYDDLVVNTSSEHLTHKGKNIVKENKRDLSKKLVKTDSNSTIKTKINKSRKHYYTSKLADSKDKIYNVKANSKIITLGKEIALLENQEDSNETKTSKLSAKYGYKIGKYALLAVHIKDNKYNIKHINNALINDLIEDNTSFGERTLNKLKPLKTKNSNSYNTPKNIINDINVYRSRHQVSSINQNKLTNKSRTEIIKVSSRLGATSKTIQSARYEIVNTNRIAKKTLQLSHEIIKYIIIAAKKAVNALLLKATVIISIVVITLAILMGIISTITTLLPAITLKSDDKELTKTYEYVTELDTDIMIAIGKIESNIFYSGVDEFHYYLNGIPVEKDDIFIYTNADALLLYLDTKYGDYAFDKFLHGLFGGINVKSIVKDLHSTLNYYTTYSWDEIEEIETTDNGENDGENDDEEYVENIKRHLDIYVNTMSFDSYYYNFKDTLLTVKEQEQLEILKKTGIYTTRARLGNPFADEQISYISSRWGWEMGSISEGRSKHTGIDIPKPLGTPVNNVIKGIVTSAGYDALNGYYVKVKNGQYEVVYSNMEYVTVSNGQEISKGDIIGAVGSSTHTTAHLHIEFYIDNGFETNPAFFIQGLVGYGYSGIGSGDMVVIAASQIGNVGGATYKYYTGLSADQPWCAAFVTWVAGQNGYLESGQLPWFVLCTSGADWFKDRGQWAYATEGYIPMPGDIIFFVGSERETQHVGIVESSDGVMVYTIEGNSSDQVRRRVYELGNINRIYGYGIPVY